MAIDLKKTDVVIVGLGAVGGVAALPLARAGLDVIGIEAGTWLSPRDFAPDELRNNFRGWPQSAQKANGEIPTHRPNASAPYSPRLPIHPMMNAVGGTTLHYWAQSWRLNPWDFKVVSETTRRYGAARIPKGSTVEDWPFGLEELEPWYDKVEYEVGVSGQAGNVGGTIDKRGNIFEGARARAYPMPALTGTEFTEHMATTARGLGWHPFPGPAAINSQTYDDRPGCLYHGFCNRGGCHVNAKNSTAVSTIPKAVGDRAARRGDAGDRHQRRGRRRQRPRARRRLSQGRRGILPARRRGAARRLHLRERAHAAAVEVEAVPQRARQQRRPGRPALLEPPHRRDRDRAVPVRPQQLVRAAGAGRRGRQLGRRQLRPFRPRLHRRRQSLGLFRPPPDLGRDHEHVRPGADLGRELEGVHQGERRPLEHRLSAEDHAALRGQRARPRPRR